MKKIILYFLLFFTQFSLAQEKRVLFLGNSYTFGNNLPSIFENLSTGASHSIFVDSYTSGGQILEGHATLATPQNKIKQGNWDVVILQEQSQIPTIPHYKENLMYPSARQLRDSIRKYNPCATIMMFMTWGRRYGGQQCDSDGTYCSPDFIDFSHMQDSLTDAYTTIGNEIEAAVAPVGRAWEDIILNTSNVLHTGDNSHPNNKGSYLAACVFYAMIWKETPVGLTTQAGVEASLAAILQESARKTVFDGDFDWNINIDSPQAHFTHEVTGQTVSFRNESSSTSAITYFWDFGDGNTSEEENPSHTYSSVGNHTVTLTVNQTDCDKVNTFSQEVMINLTSAETNLSHDDFSLFPNPTSEYLMIQSPLFLEKTYEIRIIDKQGKVLFRQVSQRKSIQTLKVSSFAEGNYFLQLQEVNKSNRAVALPWIKLD